MRGQCPCAPACNDRLCLLAVAVLAESATAFIIFLRINGSGRRQGAELEMDFDLAFIWSPLELSLRVAGAATAVSFVVATLAAWRLARKKGPMPALLDALCSLPLVLPPTVLGYYLILLVGRRGVFGHGLAELGINLIFSWQGAVVAATVVVFPLIYKSARAALEQVDKHLEDAARTLGASEWRVFISVSLPLAWKGIFAGIMLAFARGMGEFGATLMIAGNIPGKTQTLALAIYDAFQAGNDLQASWLVFITSAVCVTLLMAAELLVKLKGRRR